MTSEDRQATARPLAGHRIAVTRPQAQAGVLIDGLRELGAEPLSLPTIRIADPSDPGPLRRALDELARYDWIVFTSVNGVDRFWRELQAAGRSPSLPEAMRVAAIGPATAEALGQHGVSPQVVPDEYVAEAVADALIAGAAVAGSRVLLPRAAGSRQVLPQRLRAAGAEVDEVVAYESVANPRGITALSDAIGEGRIDMVTFTAASTVRCYVDEAGSDLGSARVAVIGPITAAAARSAGLRVDVEAREYTVPGLLDAICEYFEREEGEEHN